MYSGAWLATWLVHSKRSGGLITNWKEVQHQEIPRNHTFPALSQPAAAAVDLSVQVNGNSVIYQRKYFRKHF